MTYDKFKEWLAIGSALMILVAGATYLNDKHASLPVQISAR